MTARRPASDQPKSFAFTPENEEWVRRRIAMYPDGREAAAIIPVLWRAQEQEGWLPLAAIEHVAERLRVPRIRAFEVASFYFMFQLAPVGEVGHVQVCGTTPCMLRGAEELVRVCREEISLQPHARSEDGKLSWEEVECIGACCNAPAVADWKGLLRGFDAGSAAEPSVGAAARRTTEAGVRDGPVLV